MHVQIETGDKSEILKFENLNGVKKMAYRYEIRLSGSGGQG